MNEQLNKIRTLLLFFMIALFISGLTAIPVGPELKWMLARLPDQSPVAMFLSEVLSAYQYVQWQHQFLLYGYDWLAFAHFVLTILFIGPWKDPVRNRWVIQFGLMACILVIPFALVAGYFRGLPFWWRIIDCSFGIVGFLLLYTIYRLTKDLEARLCHASQTHKTCVI